MLKRALDVLLSALGLLVLAPLFSMVAIFIKLESPGPVFFRQERVGQRGKPFRIHKFRSMVADAENKGMQITVGVDRRVTRVGAALRKYKLDELPQLIDVFVGSMSLVGPRPEVPKYVAHYPETLRELVLSVRPGITDRASIEYKDENVLLGGSANPENTYIKEVLPVKLRFYAEYVKHRTFLGDLKIILDTMWVIFFRQ